MIRFLLILIFLISSFKIAYAQDSIDSKYLHALLYLKTNEFVNSEIKRVFSNTVKIKKREKIVDFRVRTEIQFISIYGFEDKIKHSSS